MDTCASTGLAKDIENEGEGPIVIKAGESSSSPAHKIMSILRRSRTCPRTTFPAFPQPESPYSASWPTLNSEKIEAGSFGWASRYIYSDILTPESSLRLDVNKGSSSSDEWLKAEVSMAQQPRLVEEKDIYYYENALINKDPWEYVHSCPLLLCSYKCKVVFRGE
jgi:hypothetical protein